MKADKRRTKTLTSRFLCSGTFYFVFALLPLNIFPQQKITDFAEALHTGNVEAKREALFQIRNLRSEQASRLAIPALTDSNEIVRATAASSIIFLPTDEAAGLLVPLLNEKAEFVRREAAYALGKVGSRNATDALLQHLQKDKILEVRSASAIALGEIGDVKAIESLTAILKKKPAEDDEFLRRSAARSIGQIAQIIQTGTATVTPETETRKYSSLIGQFPAFRLAVAELIQVLRNISEAPDTRREAAFSLGAIGDQLAISTLSANLTSDDPYLALISKEALLKFERQKHDR